MGGAYVSHDCGPGPNMKRPCSWQAYYDKRTARRPPNAVRVRVPHDYQRICLDFGGSVGHVSDQGLFIVNYTNSSSLELIKANGDMSNNIALKAAISKGKGTKETRSIVTAIWDWAPLGSWDNGTSAQLATLCRQLSVHSSTQVTLLQRTEILPDKVAKCPQMQVRTGPRGRTRKTAAVPAASGRGAARTRWEPRTTS